MADPSNPLPAPSATPGAPSSARTTADAQSAARGGLRAALPGAAIVVAVLAAVAIAVLWQRSDTMGREAARRLQQGDVRLAQLEAQLQQSQELSRELQSRSAVLESKLTEALGQQVQLERMYQDIAQDSIASVLADVENSVSIASQQLVVSADVRGALIALQDADGRLKRIKQPEAIGLRRLIARDIERLRVVPNVDVVGLALRLDTVASGLNQLPMVASLSPVPGASAETSAKPDGKDEGFSLQRIASTGRQGWRALIDELTQLFRVNRVDAPDALLLAPQQQYFVRENLRLTLLSARLALLARAEPVFRSDIERAIGWLDTYYDRQNRAVVNAVAALRQLESSRIAAELPSLGETLASVRAVRAAREGTQ